MSRRYLSVALIGGVAALASIAWARQDAAPRWNYVVQNMRYLSDKQLTERLDSLGTEGWELVTVYALGPGQGLATPDPRFVFKRPR